MRAIVGVATVHAAAAIGGAVLTERRLLAVVVAVAAEAEAAVAARRRVGAIHFVAAKVHAAIRPKITPEVVGTFARGHALDAAMPFGVAAPKAGFGAIGVELALIAFTVDAALRSRARAVLAAAARGARRSALPARSGGSPRARNARPAGGSPASGSASCNPAATGERRSSGRCGAAGAGSYRPLELEALVARGAQYD